MKKTLVVIAALSAALMGCPQQGVVCSEGLSACNGTCEDLQSDNAHCGACGVACGAGEICEAGACACAPGSVVCDGACVVVSSNAQHCGGCGNACGQDEVCDDGQCVVSCTAPGSVECNGGCVDPATDESNCGACGNVCEQGQSCTDGKCGWDLVAACFTNGQVVGVQADTYVKGPLKALGANPQSLASRGDVLLSLDGSDDKLYQASLRNFSKLPAEAATGQSGNHMLVEGDLAFVVNSGDGTLQVLKASGAPSETEGWALSTVGELNFGENTWPQVATKVGDKVYVTLYGGTDATTALAGQKVVEVDVSNPASPTKGAEFDLMTLELETFSEGVQGFPRPQGIVAKDGKLYVALNHFDAFYSVAGPAYLAVIPLDGSAMSAVKLPADTCLNAVWAGVHGDQIVVSCAGRANYDPNTWALVSVEATGVALVNADGTSTGVSFSCPDMAQNCAPAQVGRFALNGNDIVIGDQNAGRMFVVGIENGALVEKRTLSVGTPLDLCPVGMAGYSNISDIAVLP